MANDSTAGQVASAAITSFGNYASTAAANKKQWKYQQKAMAQQQQYNKDLWDYQNAYNTPQEQMKRLQAAGLNPHLIYGGGSASAGNAGPIAPTEVPSREAARMELPDLYSKHLIARQMDAQYAATRQATESARIQGLLNQSKTALENLKVMREDAKKGNYATMAAAEKKTAQFVAERSEQLFYSEQWKGNLMDQLWTFREKANTQQLTSNDLENAFKKHRNELAGFGIYSSDNALLRIFIQASRRMGIDLEELLVKSAQELKYLIDLAK